MSTCYLVKIYSAEYEDGWDETACVTLTADLAAVKIDELHAVRDRLRPIYLNLTQQEYEILSKTTSRFSFLQLPDRPKGPARPSGADMKEYGKEVEKWRKECAPLIKKNQELQQALSIELVKEFRAAAEKLGASESDLVLLGLGPEVTHWSTCFTGRLISAPDVTISHVSLPFLQVKFLINLITPRCTFPSS